MLDKVFQEAKKAYPNVYISGHKKVWEISIFDDEDSEEVDVPHTWQLIDAVGASFRTPEREGMLLLQEHRPGCSAPFNHWGFMVAKGEIRKEQ
ncbi:MAG: hypothetical protein AUG51_12990 [Acidobacteria bacterium 13_1_20CM_3_53_8]|nr:MAG: hypothetical protein AUG51_12990 [Acidobacteria bacterium 13_1_20CM_3_53_8]